MLVVVAAMEVRWGEARWSEIMWVQSNRRLSIFYISERKIEMKNINCDTLRSYWFLCHSPVTVFFFILLLFYSKQLRQRQKYSAGKKGKQEWNRWVFGSVCVWRPIGRYHCTEGSSFPRSSSIEILLNLTLLGFVLESTNELLVSYWTSLGRLIYNS